MRDDAVVRNARGGEEPICPVVLAKRKQCALIVEHGGRHRWVDIDWSPQPREQP